MSERDVDMSERDVDMSERDVDMSERAEILKLARLLGCNPDELSYLEQVPADELRMLREQITERMFTAHEGTLRRIAAASRLLPANLVASLGESTFGAMLSARIAGLLEPDRAVEIAAKMPTGFLADVAVELDPRRASDVIARIPPRRIFEITTELARRDEYVTMGRFVGHLNDAALEAALEALDDDALSKTLFVIEDGASGERLSRLLAQRPARR